MVVIGGFGSFPAGASVYVWGAQLEDSTIATSYIKTSGAAKTRAADIVEARSKDVGPDITKPFTINLRFGGDVANLDQGWDGEDTFYLLSLGQISLQGRVLIQVQRNSTGTKIRFRIDTSAGLVNTGYADVERGQLVTMSCTGIVASLFVDGQLASSVSISNILPLTDGSVVRFGRLGSVLSNVFSGAIQDFTVYDFAVNSDEAAYLGGS